MRDVAMCRNSGAGHFGHAVAVAPSCHVQHFQTLPLARTAAWGSGHEVVQWHLRNRSRQFAGTFPPDAWAYR